MLADLNSYIQIINNFLWSYILIFLLITIGIYFTLRTKFVQLRFIKEMLRLITKVTEKGEENKGINSFQAFCISTASRVGVGNIAGIAIAITLGGPVAIFWMWVIALIGSTTGFIESTLAQIYKVPLRKGGISWGPCLLHKKCSKATYGCCNICSINNDYLCSKL